MCRGQLNILATTNKSIQLIYLVSIEHHKLFMRKIIGANIIRFQENNLPSYSHFSISRSI